MSGLTTGQIVGGAVGAVIGFYAGGQAYQGAMIGMSLGGMIGGWIDPPPAPPPPPMGDLGVDTYVNNAPIPLAYGQNKLYGGCIWIGDVETDMVSGGKDSAAEPRMRLEFAMAHCEGVVEEYLQYWVNDVETDAQDIVVLPHTHDGVILIVEEFYETPTQAVSAYIDNDLASANPPTVSFKNTAYTYVWIQWKGGYYNSIPSFSTEAKCLLCESGEEDANPIRVLYDFLTDTNYGAGIPTDMFDGDPDTADSSWKIAADYCDELVEHYEEEDLFATTEPRFRYSNYFDKRMKGYDIVKDILQSCRGIISWVQGEIHVKIENELEDVTGYYSDEYTVGLTASGSSTTSRIYFTTSLSEPEGFWEGAYVKFVIDDVTYATTIDGQGSNYVDLVETLGTAPPNGTSVDLTKDNIKEGTFSWGKTAQTDKHNSIRIEFINRKWYDEEKETLTNAYQWDVVEHDQPEAYLDVASGVTLGDSGQQQVRLGGVKRKTQAMRMAQWYGQFNSYINFFCEFTVDVVGYLHAIGDIIGVTHTALGWEAKEFRIFKIEELDDFEVKLYCLEYDRSIYGDEILRVFHSTTSTSPSVWIAPDDIERFHIVQDETENKIYFNFKRPDDNNWWVGAQIWLKKGSGGDYRKRLRCSEPSASIKLSSAIDATQTTISFDASTLYREFSDTGEFWIEDELISYTSINDTLDQFEGCTRGSNASAHAITEYCHLKRSDHYSMDFTAADIGLTWYFKAVSMNIIGVTSDFDDAPEESILLT